MTWTYQSNAQGTLGVTASPVTINKPSGVVAGELLVSVLIFQNTIGSANFYPAYTDPSGWVTATTDAQGFGASHGGTTFAQSIHVAWLVAGASEPTSYSWTFTLGSGNAYVDGVILRFTPSAGTVAIDASENNAAVTTTPSFGASAMTIDTSALVVSVMANWDYNSGQSYTPLTLTTILGGYDGVFDFMYSVSGATTFPANEQTTLANASTWVTKAISFKITAAGAQDTPELYANRRQMQQLLAQ